MLPPQVKLSSQLRQVVHLGYQRSRPTFISAKSTRASLEVLQHPTINFLISGLSFAAGLSCTLLSQHPHRKHIKPATPTLPRGYSASTARAHNVAFHSNKLLPASVLLMTRIMLMYSASCIWFCRNPLLLSCSRRSLDDTSSSRELCLFRRTSTFRPSTQEGKSGASHPTCLLLPRIHRGHSGHCAQDHLRPVPSHRQRPR